MHRLRYFEVSSVEERAGNDDLGRRRVDDHDFTACLAAVVMLLSKCIGSSDADTDREINLSRKG